MPKKLKQISKWFFSAILSSIKGIVFITNAPQKNNFLNQIFYQECLQKMSTNLPITSDLCILTEELHDGKLKNLQKFP